MDEMPPLMIPEGAQVRAFIGDDLQGVKNLEVRLVNAKLTGLVTSAEAAYRDGLTEITVDNWQEIGNITATAAQAINNGTILFIDKNSVWTVTGTSYLTALEIEEGARILTPSGEKASITVDGNAVECTGRLEGGIVVSVG